MNIQILHRLSLLPQALSKPLSTQLLSIMERKATKLKMNNMPTHMNFYAAFIFSQGKQNFSAIDILNDEDKFKAHLEQFVGFVYCEGIAVGFHSKYGYVRKICSALLELAENNNIHIASQTFSSIKINDYTQSCIEYYQSLERN